jgi:two-component system, OmpR family, sensor kinase
MPMLRRLSIRVRLTIAFAAALGLVLALAGGFTYLTVSTRLTNAIDEELRTRLDEITERLDEPQAEPPQLTAEVSEGDGGFSQVLTPRGAVVASSLPPGAGATIEPDQVRRARQGEVLLTGLDVPGVEAQARVLARAVTTADDSFVVVAGASTEDRDAALESIAIAFAIGAPLALSLASALGYALAARALSPVTKMQRRANQITLEHDGERLPLPHAQDELYELGETLNAMLNRIEASLERERTFVADASHELRTPLTILRAELELAKRPGRTFDELRAALRSTGEEVDRLTELAENLLIMARSDQNRLAPQRADTDITALMERVRDRFAHPAAAASRSLVVDVPTGLTARVDPVQVERALLNLVDNALRHGNGTVRISAGVSDASLVLEVSDTGHGFTGGLDQAAFERFSRADNARADDGAGLGLAIVQAIARAHGGTANIASRGAPTTVRLTLPAGGTVTLGSTS